LVAGFTTGAAVVGAGFTTGAGVVAVGTTVVGRGAYAAPAGPFAGVADRGGAGGEFFAM